MKCDPNPTELCKLCREGFVPQLCEGKCGIQLDRLTMDTQCKACLYEANKRGKGTISLSSIPVTTFVVGTIVTIVVFSGQM